mgnify:CR=1 FL=1
MTGSQWLDLALFALAAAAAISGWINGATDTRTCWMCREAGYVTPAQTSLGSAA